MSGEIFLNRYQAITLLGEGGMGQVFLGRQLDNGRQVVIKFMHERFVDDPRFLKAFKREMTLMMRFRHPYAVNLYDAAISETEKPCIVMEFVRGITLSDLIDKQKKLIPFRVGKMLGQLCQVLQAAHDNGIIHRDLTPQNVMIMNRATPREQVKVMDFGLAQMGAGPYIPLEKLTGNGDGIGGGTPDYVSPEQVRREEVDHRADIYSLGVLLYKAITGFLPFENAKTTEEILNAHVEWTPPRFAQVGLNGSMPHGVERVVFSCLAKYPNDRPQSALEVAAAFGNAMGTNFVRGEPIKATILDSPDDQSRIDPQSVMDHFECWMPEPIAVVKLRGFAHDAGGEIIESEPGLIRVRLPEPVAEPAAAKGFLSMLGIGAKNDADQPNSILDLRLQQKSQDQKSVIQITVIMVPEDNFARLHNKAWRGWCQDLCRELRSYMISR